MILFIIFIIIVFIAQGIFWGNATRRVMYNKGYYDDWFWRGFFFSRAAFTEALSRPEIHRDTYQEETLLEKRYEGGLFNDDRWECTFCHSLNESIVSTCACGKSREESIKHAGDQNNVITEQNIISLLKEYKELMDNGIITQAEFDTKKRELLKK